MCLVRADRLRIWEEELPPIVFLKPHSMLLPVSWRLNFLEQGYWQMRSVQAGLLRTWVEQVGVLFQKEQRVLSGPQRCLPTDQRVDISEMGIDYHGKISYCACFLYGKTIHSSRTIC